MKLPKRKYNKLARLLEKLTIRFWTWHYKHRLKVGSNTIFFSRMEIHDPEKITIGDNCKLIYNTLNGRRGINISHGVNLSSGVKLLSTDDKPIFIGPNTFVGANAIILGGTWIGNNCRIGANSTVHDTIPSKSFYIGPKAIKKEID